MTEFYLVTFSYEYTYIASKYEVWHYSLYLNYDSDLHTFLWRKLLHFLSQKFKILFKKMIAYDLKIKSKVLEFVGFGI